MIQLRTNRTRTSFYTPALATEIQPQSHTRNKLWNPKTRRWVQDTPRNRQRLSQAIPNPKIRAWPETAGDSRDKTKSRFCEKKTPQKNVFGPQKWGKKYTNCGL